VRDGSGHSEFPGADAKPNSGYETMTKQPMLTVTIGLLVGTFLIDTQIYRYFCLGAFTALLASTVLLLAVTKVTIWPATIVLRRGRTLSAL
jgi:hypothetical protein